MMTHHRLGGDTSWSRVTWVAGAFNTVRDNTITNCIKTFPTFNTLKCNRYHLWYVLAEQTTLGCLLHFSTTGFNSFLSLVRVIMVSYKNACILIMHDLLEQL